MSVILNIKPVSPEYWSTYGSSVTTSCVSVKVNEDELRTYSNQKLIQILADNTSKSYDEINNIFKQY